MHRVGIAAAHAFALRRGHIAHLGVVVAAADADVRLHAFHQFLVHTRHQVKLRIRSAHRNRALYGVIPPPNERVCPRSVRFADERKQKCVAIAIGFNEHVFAPLHVAGEADQVFRQGFDARVRHMQITPFVY